MRGRVARLNVYGWAPPGRWVTLLQCGCCAAAALGRSAGQACSVPVPEARHDLRFLKVTKLQSHRRGGPADAMIINHLTFQQAMCLCLPAPHTNNPGMDCQRMVPRCTFLPCELVRYSIRTLVASPSTSPASFLLCVSE